MRRPKHNRLTRSDVRQLLALYDDDTAQFAERVGVDRRRVQKWVYESQPHGPVPMTSSSHATLLWLRAQGGNRQGRARVAAALRLKRGQPVVVMVRGCKTKGKVLEVRDGGAALLVTVDQPHRGPQEGGPGGDVELEVLTSYITSLVT
jgi:hypothetical protein